MKNSITISIFIHLIIIYLIFILKDIQTVIPAKAQSVAVSLISYQEKSNPVIKPRSITKAVITSIPKFTQDAEINLKKTKRLKEIEDTKTLEKKSVKEVKKTAVNPKIEKVKTEKTIKKSINKTEKLAISKTIKVTNIGQSTVDDLLGDIKDISDGSTSSYANLVINAVRPFISLPKSLNKNSLAIFQVILLPNMSVQEIKLIKSSGNQEYDENIKKAITHVKIFPQLPTKAKWLEYRKLNLTFKPG